MDDAAQGRAASRVGTLDGLSAALVLLIGLLLIDPLPVGVMRDDAIYVVLAKSLATGNGYRWLNLPGAPAATHFPPGYPAVLSVLWWVFPRFPANVIAFKALNVVLGSIVAFLGARFGRTRLGMSPVAACIASVAAALSPPVLALTTTVMSEPLFLALVLATLVVAERVVAEESSLGGAVVGGALAGVTTLARTNGIAIVVAFILLLALRRRTRDAVAAAVTATAFVLPWLVFSSIHNEALPAPMRGLYGSYGHWLIDALRANGPLIIGRTVGRTSTELAAMLGDITAPFLGMPARVVGIALVTAVLGAGAIALRRRAPVMVIFLGLYLAITVLWPFSPVRFVSGVWPLLLLVAIAGARAMLMRQAQPLTHHLIVTGVGALVVGYSTYTVAGYVSRSWSAGRESQARAMRPLVMWVARNTTAEDVLAANYEYSVYLYAHRLAVPTGSFSAEQYVRGRTQAEDVQEMREILVSYKPTTVVVSTRRAYATARWLVATHPQMLQPRADFEGGAVFTAAGR